MQLYYGAPDVELFYTKFTGQNYKAVYMPEVTPDAGDMVNCHKVVIDFPFSKVEIY